MNSDEWQNQAFNYYIIFFALSVPVLTVLMTKRMPAKIKIITYIILFPLLIPISKFIPWVLSNMSPTWMPYITAILALETGIAAYMVRCTSRGQYGIIEIVIGIYVSSESVTTGSFHFLAFAGGTYIVVRGIDNIYKQISKDKQLETTWKGWFGPNV